MRKDPALSIDTTMVSLKIEIPFLLCELLFHLFVFFYVAGSVMHYPLGIKMTTKLNTNGAVIGQREGLSRVRLNECNCQTCNSIFDVQELQDHFDLLLLQIISFFSMLNRMMSSNSY